MECFWADGLFSHIETIRQAHHGGQVFRPASRISFGYGASTDWIFTLPTGHRGGEQRRPQCCHCGHYSLYGFRGRCRRRPFLGLNHCWPLTDIAAFFAAYCYAAQANALLPALLLPETPAASFPPREERPCTPDRLSRLSRSRSSCDWKRCAWAVFFCIQTAS